MNRYYRNVLSMLMAVLILMIIIAILFPKSNKEVSIDDYLIMDIHQRQYEDYKKEQEIILKLKQQKQHELQLASRSMEERKRERYLGKFQLTAYCKCTKCCGRWSDSPCKNGEYPVEGKTIAVDIDIIPMGSTVRIEGIGERIAMDTGSVINGNIIDVYFESHKDALDFGRKKNVDVWIIE